MKIEDGSAVPILKDSGAITALAEADGFIEVPKNVEILEKGSIVFDSPDSFHFLAFKDKSICLVEVKIK